MRAKTLMALLDAALLVAAVLVWQARAAHERELRELGVIAEDFEQRERAAVQRVDDLLDHMNGEQPEAAAPPESPAPGSTPEQPAASQD